MGQARPDALVSFMPLVLDKLLLLMVKPPTVAGTSFFSVVEPDPPGSEFIWLSWIRIGIENADPDPGAWKIDKNLQINLVFCLSKRLL